MPPPAVSDSTHRVRVIRIDNPPANALSPSTLRRLREEIAEAVRSEEVEAILLTGTTQTFSSGADLKQLETDFHRHGPAGSTKAYVEAYTSGANLAPFVYGLDQTEKPIVALISGICFGGGLEVALGCHYRISTASATFRLPEVFVGIIPGALGTQFLPRMTTFRSSIELAVYGKTWDAKKALDEGIIDEILHLSGDEDSYDAVIRLASERVLELLSRNAQAPIFRSTSTLPVKVSEGDAMAISFRASLKLPPVNKGGLAQRAVLESLRHCVRAGSNFLRGAEWESEISRHIVATREAHALRYLFLAGTLSIYFGIGTRPRLSRKSSVAFHQQLCRNSCREASTCD